MKKLGIFIEWVCLFMALVCAVAGFYNYGLWLFSAVCVLLFFAQRAARAREELREKDYKVWKEYYESKKN